MLFQMDPGPGMKFLSTLGALGLTREDAAAMTEQRLTPERARFIQAVAHNAATALAHAQLSGSC
jgi:GAF domain-containing protein